MMNRLYTYNELVSSWRVYEPSKKNLPRCQLAEYVLQMTAESYCALNQEMIGECLTLSVLDEDFYCFKCLTIK